MPLYYTEIANEMLTSHCDAVVFPGWDTPNKYDVKNMYGQQMYSAADGGHTWWFFLIVNNCNTKQSKTNKIKCVKLWNSIFCQGRVR